jgi:hypothetical protein
VLDNPTSDKYFGTDFAREKILAIKEVILANSTECSFLLSRSSRTVRAVCSDRKMRQFLTGKNGLTLEPGAFDLDVDESGLMAIADMDAHSVGIYQIANDISGITSSKIISVPAQGIVRSVQILKGVINGQSYKRVAVLTEANRLVLFQQNGILDTIINIPVGPMLWKMRTEGLPNNGLYNLYAWGTQGFLGWYQLQWDPVNRQLTSRTIRMQVSLPQGGYGDPDPINGEFSNSESFADLRPMYTSNPSPSMIGITKFGNIYEVSLNGILLSTPQKNTPLQNGQLIPKTNSTWNEYLSLGTCNNQNSWKSCMDVLVADNFQTGGVTRFTYTPTNFGGYIPFQISAQDLSSPGGNVSKPSITFSNISPFDFIQGPKIRLWGSREEMPSQQVAADLYYSRIPGVQLSTGYDSLNPNLWYVDVTYPRDSIFGPNQGISLGDLQLGIHFLNYWPGVWDATNDWSLKGLSPVLSELPCTIYSWNPDSNYYSLVFGSLPDPKDYPQPQQYTVSSVFHFGQNTWTVQAPTIIAWKDTTGPFVTIQGYTDLASFPLNPNYLDFTSSKITVNLQLPTSLPNPWWIGSLGLSFDSPLNGIWNQWVGQVNLGGAAGSIVSLNFPMPSNLSGKPYSANDFVIHLLLNGPSGSVFKIKSITWP